jgi:hypothetical protein
MRVWVDRPREVLYSYDGLHWPSQHTLCSSYTETSLLTLPNRDHHLRFDIDGSSNIFRTPIPAQPFIAVHRFDRDSNFFSIGYLVVRSSTERSASTELDWPS